MSLSVKKKPEYHGHSPKSGPTGAYGTWQQMRDRCLNKDSNNYKYYGGRGIGICREWQISFVTFLADMGDRPEGKTLDRIDNNKGYSKDNCRWATHKEQMRNSRAVTQVEYLGKKKPICAWAEEFGIKEKTIGARLRYGWDVHSALTKPVYTVIWDKRRKSKPGGHRKG